MSRRTIVRSAALASIVEASTPIRFPSTKPCSATSFNTSRIPSRGLHAATARASSTTTSDREPLPVLQPQEIAQRHRIRAPPGNASLAGAPLKITNHVHPEIAPRRQRRGTHLRGVLRLARRLDKPVTTACDQHFLKLVVEHVSWRARHLRQGHDQIALPIALVPHRHLAIRVQSSCLHRIDQT